LVKLEFKQSTSSSGEKSYARLVRSSEGSCSRSRFRAGCSLLLLMNFPDLLHHPIEIIQQPVMIHEHLATRGYQHHGGYDRLFQYEIDFPFFVRKNRKEQLEPSFEIIRSLFVVCYGYDQDLNVLF
jgi:hypothetical protein